MTIVNIEGLAGLAVEKNQDPRKQPTQKFFTEWLALVTKTVDKKIDNHFSPETISGWLFND